MTTDIYISGGYLIEEGITDGTQYFVMKKAQCQFGYPGICYEKCQELERCFLKRSRIIYPEK